MTSPAGYFLAIAPSTGIPSAGDPPAGGPCIGLLGFACLDDGREGRHRRAGAPRRRHPGPTLHDRSWPGRQPTPAGGSQQAQRRRLRASDCLITRGSSTCRQAARPTLSVSALRNERAKRSRPPPRPTRPARPAPRGFRGLGPRSRYTETAPGSRFPRTGGRHTVEVPGIEPGSFVVLSGLLRAQLTMPLLGPTGIT